MTQLGSTDWTGQLSRLEERAEADSLEDLQHRRRTLMTANARLIALHGSFGHWDAHRKRMVEAMKVKERMELKARGDKATDDAVDALAHASEQYGQFLDNSLEERAQCLLVLNEISDIEDRIKNREIALRAYTVEAGLR